MKIRKSEWNCITLGLLLLVSSMGCGEGVVGDLDGVWSSSCIEGVRATLRVDAGGVSDSDGSYSLQFVYYSDDDCTTEGLSTVESGTFDVKNSVGEIEDAFQLNLFIQKIEWRPATDAMASYLNSDPSLCGISTWEKGVAEEITGLACDGMETSPHTQYDIFRIEFSEESSNLYLGDRSGSYDGSTSNKRPISLNLELSLRKQ